MPDYLHGVQVVNLTSGVRPIRTIKTGIIGVVGTAPLADANEFPLNEPVLITGSRAKAALLGADGTLPQVMDAIFDQIAPVIVVVRVDEGVDDAATQSNVIGSVDVNGKFLGLKALLVAESKLGVKPRILGAPGFTHVQAVTTELVSIADQLRGFAYADAPSGTAEAAVTHRDLFGAERLMQIFPEVKVWDTVADDYVDTPASAFALGLRAKIDNDVGWHKTISNLPFNGISGLSQDIDVGGTASKANYLNENEVTTIIKREGERFWGSRTCSADPMFAFESAVRTNDILAETIQEAHNWAIDKPMSQTLIDDILRSVNAKFQKLKADGYIVNAEAYLDPDLNTEATLAAGQLWLNYEFTPVPPLEQLTFNAIITNKYLVELLPAA
jgi:hypothetical protein